MAPGHYDGRSPGLVISMSTACAPTRITTRMDGVSLNGSVGGQRARGGPRRTGRWVRRTAARRRERQRNVQRLAGIGTGAARPNFLICARIRAFPGSSDQHDQPWGTASFTAPSTDYFRNEDLDGNDWFANSRGYGRAESRQNRVGGTLGGPVIKNRTYFFITYEHLGLMSPSTLITSVPDLQTRQSAPAAIRPFFEMRFHSQTAQSKRMAPPNTTLSWRIRQGPTRPACESITRLAAT